ncbi:MAG: hypothetical protein EXQ95_02915 [Alphaproteobacteria bacterium]|nr:hypothetical protein [Alphaproteobacteria bacterium]
MRSSSPIFLSVIAILLVQGMAARAQPLVADLSQHLVAITAGFTGADIVMFGATDGPGDVVVVVTGPPKPTIVRRKGRLAGIWVNREAMLFADAPTFYGIATSKPIDEVLAANQLDRHQIGVDHIRLLPPNPEARRDDIPEFRQALVRARQRDGLFATEPGKVTFLGERLFRARMALPAKVATGTYRVQVFLVREGQVVTVQTTPLLVSKIGFSADVFDLAHQDSALYGLAAILIATAAGWTAAVAFRRI